VKKPVWVYIDGHCSLCQGLAAGAAKIAPKNEVVFVPLGQLGKSYCDSLVVKIGQETFTEAAGVFTLLQILFPSATKVFKFLKGNSFTLKAGNFFYRAVASRRYKLSHLINAFKSSR
jgi:predicted DCC family thiol-disulfide oxidoreductase YuxK